jgi:hypothetical protein
VLNSPLSLIRRGVGGEVPYTKLLVLEPLEIAPTQTKLTCVGSYSPLSLVRRGVGGEVSYTKLLVFGTMGKKAYSYQAVQIKLLIHL